MKEPEALVISEQALAEQWYLRPRDAARLTGLGETTIREAIYRGSLKARKFRARGWLIEKSELRRWVEAESLPSEAA